MRMASRADMLKGSMARGGIKGKPKDESKMRAPVDRSKVKGSVKAAPTKTEPKKYGEGDQKVIRGNKANVSAEQLKASGLSLRAYMNQWNKTGKRPGKKA
jgi:hypothetical protein